MKKLLLALLAVALVSGCADVSRNLDLEDIGLRLPDLPIPGLPEGPRPFYLGADLSYVNEMEDCGAVYRKNGRPVDPFALLKHEGGDLVRVRLWNDPRWTRYSNLQDVKKTIGRAKANGLKVLLDFHYSDDWADGDKQRTPAAWAGMTGNEQVKALREYTQWVLLSLERDGLMPEMVQVGNETNPELLGGTKERPINWARNAALLNAGIQGVKDAARWSYTKPEIMLHIAQPENVEPWFAAAHSAGVEGYDIIGISYYKKWSTRSMAELGQTIARIGDRFDKDVMLVETAYPFTNQGADNAPNLLGPDTLIPGYPATPAGQRQYLIDLTQIIANSGGIGVVYWEPAWVSTRCSTRWGVGSNWENAAWFSLDTHEALPAFDFLRYDYGRRRR